MNQATKIGIATAGAVGLGLLLSYRLRAAYYAQKWVGIKEVGQNKGFSNAAFQQMMKDIGWKGGEQWCMYFAKMVHVNTFPKEAADIRKILVGNTQNSFKNALNDKTGTYKVITSGRPKKGDIVIWQRTNDTSKGHAGVVIGFKGDKMITIEGNTNLAGAAEGDAVLQKERNMEIGKTEPKSTLRLRGFIRKRIPFLQ